MEKKSTVESNEAEIGDTGTEKKVVSSCQTVKMSHSRCMVFGGVRS